MAPRHPLHLPEITSDDRHSGPAQEPTRESSGHPSCPECVWGAALVTGTHCGSGLCRARLPCDSRSTYGRRSSQATGPTTVHPVHDTPGVRTVVVERDLWGFRHGTPSRSGHVGGPSQGANHSDGRDTVDPTPTGRTRRGTTGPDVGPSRTDHRDVRRPEEGDCAGPTGAAGTTRHSPQDSGVSMAPRRRRRRQRLAQRDEKEEGNKNKKSRGLR